MQTYTGRCKLTDGAKEVTGSSDAHQSVLKILFTAVLVCCRLVWQNV